VNVIGYLRAQSGLGEAARATVRALQHLDNPVSVVDVSHRVYSRHQPLDVVPETGTPYDITVVHLNPEELLGYAHDDLRYRFGADRVIGAWFWETDEIPASWLPAFDVVDELWVASEFLATTFGKHTDKDIVRVGLPVDLPVGVAPDRERFGIPTDAFVVIYVTDAYSGWDRKNPIAAVEAFRGAFADDPDAHLVLKISNLEKFPSHAQELSAALKGVNATVIGEYLDRDALWQLLACSDVYLSLHASEGFGLTVIEAMALGVPVVATAYGGTMDFTTPETALLVDYELVPARGGPGGAYTGNGQWARPDLAQAGAHLRTLRSDPALARQLGEAGRRTAATATAEAQARRIAARLKDLGFDQPAADSTGFQPTTA
jgi:glycosyltransferase involved in cell wall biosynthesis